MDDFEAWRCPVKDRFPDGPSAFCPDEGCPVSEGCARDRGWLPDSSKGGITKGGLFVEVDREFMPG